MSCSNDISELPEMECNMFEGMWAKIKRQIEAGETVHVRGALIVLDLDDKQEQEETKSVSKRSRYLANKKGSTPRRERYS